MKDDIRLSEKESRRVYVLEQVTVGNLTAGQAATVLGLSIRHVKRLKGEMIEQGVASLAHGNRGRKPSNIIPDHIRQKVLELANGICHDASCQHISEILAALQPPIQISAKSIARILKAAGITLAHTHKPARGRRTRERMPQEGLLVQIDASDFNWLDDRGPQMFTLHGAIDDATSKILGLYFRPNEDMLGYLHVLRQVLVSNGIPQSIYSDRHTIFKVPDKFAPSIEEELAGMVHPLTQYGQALDDLKITHIAARTPQAKGRVERLWGTLQHRLLVELRLANINTIEDANAFLPGFIERHNKRFAVAPANAENAYRPCPSAKELVAILATRAKRSTDSGSTIHYLGQRYQLVKDNGHILSIPSKHKVTMLGCLDGELRAQYLGVTYEVKQVTQPKPAPSLVESPPTCNVVKQRQPQQNHPWKRSYKVARQCVSLSKIASQG